MTPPTDAPVDPAPGQAAVNERHQELAPNRTGTVAKLAAALAGGRLAAALILLTQAFAGAGVAQAAVVTGGADNLRTGWYPNQPGLTADAVQSSFGQLASVPVIGQVYAQPLVANDTLFVATEDNYIYGLDPVTGAAKWPARQVGTPWNFVDIADPTCHDLDPHVGITGTPVIDTTTNTAYFFDKEYLSGSSGPAGYFMHAIDLATGLDRFPAVAIGGTAQNQPSVTFSATHALQRPGLLLMNGIVYAGFGGTCDKPDWQGWIFGISTTSGQIASRWVATSGGNGASVWQSGGGLVSDGTDQILFSTGNYSSPGNNGSTQSPTPIDGHGSPPQANLGDSVVRTSVQPNGTLRATDFFAPHNDLSLDNQDLDLGSGTPVALPSAYFGTASHPHLMVASGKEGYLYLLDRDSLGGYSGSGPDRVLTRLGPWGSTFAGPAVWPGDGGYLWVPNTDYQDTTSDLLRVFHYGIDGSGNPTLSLAASSTDHFNFGSGAPIVTSDGVRSGSGLVWMVHLPARPGDPGAELRVYRAVPPDGGNPVALAHWPIGIGSKFAAPGVANGMIYVGTRDGHVLYFGANSPSGSGPSPPPASGGPSSPVGPSGPGVPSGPAGPAPATSHPPNPVRIGAMTALRIGAMTVTPPSFWVTRPRRSRRPLGTTIGFMLGAPARVTFRVERANPGIRRGKSCVGHRRRRRRSQAACLIYTPVGGTFAEYGHPGLNRLHFDGRVGGHRLRAGHYRLRAAVGAASSAVPGAVAKFSVWG